MGRRISGLMLSIIILSMTLSGCISSKENYGNDDTDEDPELVLPSVSYTHLTLPTKRIV